MTERIYYNDSYVRGFEANVVTVDGARVYLDRTAFYPASGGQPSDRGRIGSAAVMDVIDEGERIAHLVNGATPSGAVTCEIDWARRLDFMQQHTGQHLLSAVFEERFGFKTVAVHFGDAASTLEMSVAAVSPEQLHLAAQRASEIVFENRPVNVTFEHSTQDLGLRRAVERAGELRIVSIADLDRSACGGTHVRSTAEIGPILIRRTEKIRGNTRVEFLCGMRAVRRAQTDFEALSAIARTFSSSLEEAPDLVKAQAVRVAEMEKSRKKLVAELAQFKARELYQGTAPDASGVRRIVLREPITDDLRVRVTAFTALPKTVAIVLCPEPPSMLVAASKDSGVNAGDVVKQAIAAHGGRGGGSAVMAQASLPSKDVLEAIVAS